MVCNADIPTYHMVVRLVLHSFTCNRGLVIDVIDLRRSGESPLKIEVEETFICTRIGKSAGPRLEE